jgi:hypothetical protein
MLSIYLFLIAVVVSLFRIFATGEKDRRRRLEIFLCSILVFNMGLMSLLAAYAHVFMSAITAVSIGWEPGSPFQYEVGMANLSYGVLGVLCYWYRGRFWTASILGWSILLLGCFVGHLINYYQTGNTAPNNIGVFVWFYDLFLPLLSLALLSAVRPSARE